MRFSGVPSSSPKPILCGLATSSAGGWKMIGMDAADSFRPINVALPWSEDDRLIAPSDPAREGGELLNSGETGTPRLVMLPDRVAGKDGEPSKPVDGDDMTLRGIEAGDGRRRTLCSGEASSEDESGGVVGADEADDGRTESTSRPSRRTS